MLIKLKSLRAECTGCPTSYSGETVDGEHFEAYLRHGYMKIELDGVRIVSENPQGLDGVCSFSDFKHYAKVNGYMIDETDAEWSSEIEDMEKRIQEMFKDTVWVRFLTDFYSKSTDKTYNKGERYTARIDVADALVDAGLAFVDDSSYERKKENWIKENSLK